MNKYKKIIEKIILIISIILFIIGELKFNLNSIICAIILLIIHNLIVSFYKNGKDINIHINFFIYNITFFTLLVGRYFVFMIFKIDYKEEFSEDIVNNSLILLYISLISILIGTYLYKIYNKFEITKKVKHSINKIIKKLKRKNKICSALTRKITKEEKILYIRRISKILYIITFIFAIVLTLEKVIFVQQHTYIYSFIGFESIFPIIFKKIAQMHLLFFLIYLFTYPNKKQTYLSVGIYIIYLALTILTGERGTAVTTGLMLMIYFVYRQMNIKADKFFTRKSIFVLTCISIIIIVFLSSYNIWRNNNSKIENFNFINQFIQFFVDQGTSSKVMSYVQKHIQELPETNINYTFGPFINYVSFGTLAQIFNNAPEIYKTNTEEMALYGNNLGETISYIVMQERYLEGEGIGTQYIAELYIDYSYAGVILFNILLGWILIALQNLNKDNCAGLAFSLLTLKEIIYLPRQQAMLWAMNLISIPYISCLIITSLLTKIIFYIKVKKEEKNMKLINN